MKGLASLAGTGKQDYVPMQVRVKGTSLHVQGNGPEVNRGYGVSADLTNVDPQILEWVTKHAFTPSLAKTRRSYALVQAMAREGMVHFQGNGSELNRDYGIAFNDGTNEDIVAFIKLYLSTPDPTPIYSVNLA